MGSSLLTADTIMLSYLVENLVEAVLQLQKEGCLDVTSEKEEGFVKYSFAFQGRTLTDEQRTNLFYPDALRLNPEDGSLIGAQWLIARQIVREHDEHVRRGCRIYAETDENKQQITVCFTIPVRTNS